MSTISSAGTTSPSLFSRQTGQSPVGDFSNALDESDEFAETTADQTAKLESIQRKNPASAMPADRSNSKTDLKSPISVGSDDLDASKDGSSAPESTLLLIDQVVQPVGLMGQLLVSRVYGDHLLAGGYLSVLATADPVDDVATDAFVDIVESPIKVAAQGSDPVQKAVIEAPSWGTEPSDFIEDGTACLQSVDTSTTADDVEATDARQGLSSGTASVWLDQLTRSIKQADGSSVVWVRDFRLTDEDARSCVAEIISDAQSRNVPLARIFLNGRQIWSAHNASETE